MSAVSLCVFGWRKERPRRTCDRLAPELLIGQDVISRVEAVHGIHLPRVALPLLCRPQRFLIARVVVFLVVVVVSEGVDRFRLDISVGREQQVVVILVWSSTWRRGVPVGVRFEGDSTRTRYGVHLAVRPFRRSAKESVRPRVDYWIWLDGRFPVSLIGIVDGFQGHERSTGGLYGRASGNKGESGVLTCDSCPVTEEYNLNRIRFITPELGVAPPRHSTFAFPQTTTTTLLATET